jgi:hypothetical protein
MSWYVKRTNGTRTGFTGPIRSEQQAGREVAAWQEAGWEAVALPNTAEVRAEVKAWEKATAARKASEPGWLESVLARGER